METKQWLDKYYPNSTLFIQLPEKLIVEFKSCRINTNNSERSGRRYEVVNLENIGIANLSNGVFTILHKYLGMQKLHTSLVSRKFPVDQKQ